MSTDQPKTAKLPAGEVTFLFTDVVGSSRLWEEHGDGFIPIWQAHDAVIRDAFTRFGGYEVKTEGDSFMIAFSNPEDAVHCALFAQAALARYPWPADTGQVRVRMGLHTGEPIVHGQDYFGPVVNRAANTCKAAHGGQILATEEVIQKAGSRLDPKVDLNDLGAHRLKDMGAPQRLFEPRHTDLVLRNFPPPRTLEGQPHNLPLQRTSFVGRAYEIEQIASYLGQGEKPVLTVTGPTGIGKTRLSLQAAAAHADWFPDGVWYVTLDQSADVNDAASAIASSIGIQLSADMPTVDQVRNWLANRRCLLILDDAGAVQGADRLIRDITSGNNGLRCLATSRETLNIEGTQHLHLGGLSVQADSQSSAIDTRQASKTEYDLGASDAGSMFITRAAEVNPDFTLTNAEQLAAQKLIAWLEGVPGSIERAAQMMDRFEPSWVLSELEKRLAPIVPSTGGPGVERLKGIVKSSAQKVKVSFEEAARNPSNHLGRLIQGIANIATDRNNEAQAVQLGRESLRISQAAGDELGVADALRQLARLKSQQGDHESARAMLSVAAQIYRKHQSESYRELQRDLYAAGESTETESEKSGSLLVQQQLTAAVDLAMKEAT